MVALLVAGCAGWTTDPELTLHVDSGIDRPLLVYVNGDWVGTIPAGATDATVPASGHGGPPWTAEGRVASGTVLITLPDPGHAGTGRRAHDDGRDRLRNDHDDRRRARSRSVAGPAGAGHRAAPCD